MVLDMGKLVLVPCRGGGYVSAAIRSNSLYSGSFPSGGSDPTRGSGPCDGERAVPRREDGGGGGRSAAGHGGWSGSRECHKIGVEGGGGAIKARDALEGGRYCPLLQGAQPMPSHCLPNPKCQLQWHL